MRTRKRCRSMELRRRGFNEKVKPVIDREKTSARRLATRISPTVITSS